MKISILIPVYNEFLTLPLVVQRVLAAPLPEGCEKEVIIVDDGSTDGTTELLGQYRHSPVVLVHHSPVNFGKGAALRIGLGKATGDIVLIQDGDLEYDPQDYTNLVTPILRGETRIVYGSRFRAGSRKGIRDMKWANWLGNRWLTWTANLLYAAHLTDEATAYKAFAREVIDAIDLKCIRFEFCPEITAKARRLGFSITEVPISYNPRGILEGKKIRWQDGVQAIWTLVRYRFGSTITFDRRILASQRAKFANAR